MQGVKGEGGDFSGRHCNISQWYRSRWECVGIWGSVMEVNMVLLRPLSWKPTSCTRQKKDG